MSKDHTLTLPSVLAAIIFAGVMTVSLWFMFISLC